ncbi:MAG: hypothetical protein Ct9H300mP12_00090 [Acidimicrobiales bacterium]|nr:MAG: hypothetical protein Ct9H300mP12_00090 [Acidimicrobiales bacterium]
MRRSRSGNPGPKVNYRYTGDELAYILENADAEALFFDHTLVDRVAGSAIGVRSCGW